MSDEEAPPEGEHEDKILYALIARGQTSLVDFSVREGNHILLAQQILAKAKQDTDHKRSFPDKSGKFIFQYMLKDGITYLCFATADKKTAVCFTFLDEIRAKFCGTYDKDVISRAMAYSTTFLDFKRILKEEMAHYSAMEHADANIAEVSEKLDMVKATMKTNIDKLWERDSEIEDLLEKTQVLETESTALKVNAKKLASKFWWKNFKIWVIIIVVVIVLLWLVFSLICGFKFQCLTGNGGGVIRCFHEDSQIAYEGRMHALKDLLAGREGECVVPHVLQARGVQIHAACVHDAQARVLRLTEDHLVATARGWIAAGAVHSLDVVYADYARALPCRVLRVVQEAAPAQYFGLNCKSSVVLADGVLTSTFGRLHTLPALWMRYASPLLGLSRASRFGDALAQLFANIL